MQTVHAEASRASKSKNLGGFVKHVFTLALFPLFLGVIPSEAQDNRHKFVGTGSCSSSNCHGGVQPRKSSDVLQNEYGTWIRHDKHSKAYTALLTEDANRMTMLLGMKPAAEEPLCLKCHATYVEDAERKGDKYQLEDGVSCESCHGAAEGWLESHAQTGTTHSDNLEKGLADTVSLEPRAKLCLSCHYGDEEKSVTHDLYGVGHPRLRFELDTFGILQPKHWVIDEDYIERKGPYMPLKAWLIGQVAQAKQALAALASPSRSKRGSLPELSLFDCYSCHHSLTEEQWKHRTYGGAPGQLKLNLPSLVIIKEAISTLDAATSKELGELVAALHAGFKEGEISDEVDELSELLDDTVAPIARSITGDDETCLSVLRSLSAFAAKAEWPTYEVAEQIGMGIQATMASSQSLSKRFENELRELFEALATPKAFTTERFMISARKLHKAVNNS